jgi:hypothetical protein
MDARHDVSGAQNVQLNGWRRKSWLPEWAAIPAKSLKAERATLMTRSYRNPHRQAFSVGFHRRLLSAIEKKKRITAKNRARRKKNIREHDSPTDNFQQTAAQRGPSGEKSFSPTALIGGESSFILFMSHLCQCAKEKRGQKIFKSF